MNSTTTANHALARTGQPVTLAKSSLRHAATALPGSALAELGVTNRDRFLYATIAGLIANLPICAAVDSGWNKAKWGMTLQQLAQAYPEARQLPEPETYEQLGQTYVSVLGIEQFELAGGVYNVRFLMEESQSLGGVILSRRSDTPLATDHSVLEKLLTQKYGQPSIAKDTPNGWRSVSWTPSGVSITLNHIATSIINEFAIKLIYLKPHTALLEKL